MSIRDIYQNKAVVDFRSAWRIGAAISLTLVAISIGALLIRGLNLGIEFEGGTAWELIAPDLSVADTRDALRPAGLADAKIQTVGSDTVRVQSDTADDARIDEIRGILSSAAGIESSEVSVTTVGPSWGQEISSKALRALIWFFIAIALYITVRNEWKMAVGALAAVVHDILITVGTYALFQFEVTPATVIAFLTILGYSLYDTIVVFDKVRENTIKVSAANGLSYSGMMSRSLNQVLMRSINTTITSVLPVLSMLIIGAFVLGATTLREFSLALLIGLLAGTYSSLFVAAPIVAWLKEREPEYGQIRHRLESKGRGDDEPPRRSRLEQAALDAEATEGSGSSGRTSRSKSGATATKEKAQRQDGADESSAEMPDDDVEPSDTATVLGHAPRPRKKGRKK